MEEIPEEQNVEAHKPQISKPIKSMSKINNNRFLNQNIYNTFLQKRYGQCLTLINKSQSLDQFKTYIKSLIQKNSYHLDKSLNLLNQCHIMNKLNYSYLKSISKNYFLLGKYKSSLQVAKDAHRINSNDYQIFYILAKISLALGDKEGAIAYFKTANGKQPSQESYIQLAKIYMDMNQYIQANDLLKECAEIAPQNPQLFEMLGICNCKIGKLQSAFHAYRQALEIDAANYASLIGSGSIELERGAIDQALQIFKKAFKTSPNSAVLWNNIGIATFRKNKQVAAYCCFKRALFLQPFRWDIHSNLALLFMKKKKYLAAEVHLQSALKLNRDPTLFNLLGVCLIELKDYQNASMAFNEGLKMNPQYYEAVFNNIICIFKQGDKPKAKTILTELQRKCNDGVVKDKIARIKEKIMQ